MDGSVRQDTRVPEMVYGSGRDRDHNDKAGSLSEHRRPAITRRMGDQTSECASYTSSR